MATQRSDRFRRRRFPILLLLALLSPASAAAQGEPTSRSAVPGLAPEDPHARLLAAEQYPSAKQCGACHDQIYEEWSSSAHAYAAISPMFHKFEQRINELANGTVGAFCVRCHISVGTAMGEERWLPLWDRSPVSLEGVTCISCHRVEETYGRVNGERRIVPGTLQAPVQGPTGAPVLDGVIERRKQYGVDPVGDGDGAPIHADAHQHRQITKSEFCASCHQVAVHPGIKLEVVWEQYRDSPARAAGTTCQDCHMSTNPGKASGYASGPRAVVNQQPIEPPGKHTDHAFVGPGYSIAHPGIFPHNRLNQYSTKEWMSFDWRAGWGELEWERSSHDPGSFPPEWRDLVDDGARATSSTRTGPSSRRATSGAGP